MKCCTMTHLGLHSLLRQNRSSEKEVQYTEPKFYCNALRARFFTTNGCRVVYVRKLAQLFLNNLYRTENTLSGAWFCELLSDWSKTLFGSQDLVSGRKVKKSICPHSKCRPVSVFLSLKIVLLNFTKLSLEFQLIEI